MPETHTPLFRADCIGATIAHVDVFPTHITYGQKLGRDITVTADMIASVEKREHEFGYIILSTKSRRRIICTVSKDRAGALYTAIRSMSTS